MHRRNFMKASVAAGLTASAPALPQSDGPSTYDLNDLEDLLEAQVKLRGSLDGQLTMWWIRAKQFAVVETVLVPLFDLINASFQRFDRLPGGAFGITMLELAYFTDLETGEPLDEFLNPITGKTGKVPPALFGPNRISLDTDGRHPPSDFPFGELVFEGELGPAHTDGEEVWIRDDTFARMTSTDPAYGDFIYSELVFYQGRLDHLNDPSLASAPATLTYSTTSNWRPWMQPEDTPGHLMADGFGRKVSRVDDLPADYLAIARERHPDVLADPEKFLNKGAG